MLEREESLFNPGVVFLVPLPFVFGSIAFQEKVIFLMIGGRERDTGSEEGDCQTLCCNYTDDASTQMHHGYGNLMK